MPVDDIATATAASLDIGVEEFQRRVREDAGELKSAVHDGTFDHPQAIVGLEYEFYAVVDEAGAVEPDGALMRVPRGCWTTSGSRRNWACTTPRCRPARSR